MMLVLPLEQSPHPPKSSRCCTWANFPCQLRPQDLCLRISLRSVLAPSWLRFNPRSYPRWQSLSMLTPFKWTRPLLTTSKLIYASFLMPYVDNSMPLPPLMAFAAIGNAISMSTGTILPIWLFSHITIWQGISSTTPPQPTIPKFCCLSKTGT